MKLKMSVTLRYSASQHEVNNLKKYLHRAMRDFADGGKLTGKLDAELVDYDVFIEEIEDFNTFEDFNPRIVFEEVGYA